MAYRRNGLCYVQIGVLIVARLDASKQSWDLVDQCRAAPDVGGRRPFPGACACNHDEVGSSVGREALFLVEQVIMPSGSGRIC